eukprot:scaffold5222_cov293-Pinguiococcus_pyrenoidosus.AAC.8
MARASGISVCEVLSRLLRLGFSLLSSRDISRDKIGPVLPQPSAPAARLILCHGNEAAALEARGQRQKDSVVADAHGPSWAVASGRSCESPRRVLRRERRWETAENGSSRGLDRLEKDGAGHHGHVCWQESTLVKDVESRGHDILCFQKYHAVYLVSKLSKQTIPTAALSPCFKDIPPVWPEFRTEIPNRAGLVVT